MASPRPLAERRLWQFQAVRDLGVLAALVGAVWLGWALSAITVPLLVGLALAYMVEPLIVWMTRRCTYVNRTQAVLLLIVILVLTCAGAAATALPPLVRQAVTLGENSNKHLSHLEAWAMDPQRPVWLRERAGDLHSSLARLGLMEPLPTTAEARTPPPSPSKEGPKLRGNTADSDADARIRSIVREELDARGPAGTVSAVGVPVSGALVSLSSGVGSVLGSMLSIALFITVAAISAISFSLAWPSVIASGTDLLPLSRRARILELLGRMDITVSAFIRGRLTVAAIVGALYALGWSLVGVPYGLVLGLVVGVLSLVPYLAAVGLPLAWILVATHLMAQPDPGSWYVSQGANGQAVIHWWLVLLLPALVNVVVQVLEDYVLTPLIQGKATELHPTAIMIAVIAGGLIAGLYGMLLAVPAAACAKILLNAEILPRLRTWAEASGANTKLPPA